jgi:hypothetical protein
MHKRGVGNRIIIIMLVLTLLGFTITFFSTSTKAGIAIWPGKLSIDMHEGFPDENIEYEFKVTNKNNFDINVTTIIKHPIETQFDENYTYIPNLNWIKTYPEKISLNPYEFGYFTVSIDIPESERANYYNEQWEVIIRFKAENPVKEGSINIQIFPEAKLFINTPVGESPMNLSFNHIVYIGIGVFISLIIIFFFKKRY